MDDSRLMMADEWLRVSPQTVPNMCVDLTVTTAVCLPRGHALPPVLPS